MTLRELLAEGRGEILSRFVDRVRAEHPQGVVLTECLLLDGLPCFLDEVVAALDAGAQFEAPSLSRAGDHGGEHGEQRYALGLDVVTVAREWSIVRDVILELALERDAVVSVSEYRTLSRHVSEAAISAIREHVEITDRERERTAARHLGFLVHDLRNQLTAAVAAVSWMRKSPRNATEATQAIEASLAELTHVLERELTLSRLTTLRAGVETNFAPIAIADLLAVVESETRPVRAALDVTLRSDCEPGLVVAGEFRLLRSALINLIGNAVKFTRRATEVSVRARRVGEVAEIRVSDKCGGLGEGLAEQLQRGHSGGGDERSGFGLGLAIARQSIEVHGGMLAVTDQPGEGCTFTVTIPLVTSR